MIRVNVTEHRFEADGVHGGIFKVELIGLL